jgi:PAS domain S-box-containing protein
LSYSESNSSIEDYESYVKFINSLNDGFELLETRLDNNGNIIDYVFLNVNPAYERQTGLRASNILGRRKKEVAPAAEQRWYDYALQALETGRIQSYQYFNPNVNRYFETQFIPIPPGKIAVLFKDITERKQAEEALVQSQKNFKNIIKQSPIAFSLFDEKGFLVQVNSAWDEQWQIPHQLVLGKFNILESEQIIDGGFIPDIRRVYAGMTIKNYELEFDASTVPLTQGYGRKRCLAATAYPIKNESGEVSIVVLTEDITERKKNELALKETEEKFEGLFEQSPSVFEIYNNEGLLIRANKAWEKLYLL